MEQEDKKYSKTYTQLTYTSKYPLFENRIAHKHVAHEVDCW